MISEGSCDSEDIKIELNKLFQIVITIYNIADLCFNCIFDFEMQFYLKKKK